MSAAGVQIREIVDDDGPAVADFLHTRLNPRVPASAWLGLIRTPWAPVGPNHGFQLLVDGALVGVYVAIYSRRVREDAEVTVCNLAAFCVEPEHRAHGLRLLRRLLSQDGMQFTDLSPSGNVVALNARLGFSRIDTATRLVPNLPWPGRRGVGLSDAPAVISATLRGRDAVVYADHRDAAAARHLVVTSGDSYAYLMFRRDRRRGLRLFASPIFAGGERELLAQAWPQVGSHLLTRHGLPATLAEQRVLGFAPRLGRALASPRPKMVLGDRISSDEVDYLYSELVLVEW